MARTRQRQETQEIQGFTPVATGTGVSFLGGVMHVNGRAQQPREVAQFESSNGLTTYTTVVWQDGVTGERRTSCNCPGWAHAKKGGSRGCCHTRELETGVPCGKRRVTNRRIHSVEEAVEAIPEIHEGRELRAFTW